MEQQFGGQAMLRPGVSGGRWASFLIGATALLVIGLQPILFGALIAEGPFALPDLTLGLTLEILMIALSAALGGLWRSRVRMKAALLLIIIALMDLLSAQAALPEVYLLSRTLAGLAEGGLLAIATELVIRSARPQRTGGHFSILQILLQCVLAAGFAFLLIPFGGTDAAFALLGAISIGSIFLVGQLPRDFGREDFDAPADQAPTPGAARGLPLMALGHIFFFFLFIGASWGFLEPLGVQSRVAPGDIRLVASLGLGLQLAGAVVATWMAERICLAMTMASLGGLVVCGLLFLRSDWTAFAAAVLLASFLLRFVIPFHIGFAVMADPTRRTARLVPPVQLAGAALGPVAASLFTSGRDAGTVPLFGIGCVVLSLSLLGFCRQALSDAGRFSRAKAAPDARWRNWSGSVQANPQALARPETIEELAETIRNAPQPVRIAGTGHSFTPLVQCEGTIIDMRAFSGFVSHDPDRMQATFGAATELSLLTPALRRVGQGLLNMGDIDKQSFAGALGTATHGTGLSLGAFHTQVQRLSLVDGRGRLRIIDRDADPDLLHATGVTLGLFGALTEVTVQTMPSYRLRRRRWIVPLDEILTDMAGFLSGHRSAEFFFVPYSGHVMLCTADLTTEPTSERPTEDDEAALAILKRMRSTLAWAPWLRRKLIGTALKGIPAEDYVQEWQNVYASERVTRFNEMEYHLPFEAGAAAFSELVTLCESRFPEIYFPFEVRAVAADPFWLSPFYQRPTCSIAIHHDAAEDPTAFMREAEVIFRRYDGRPHWGKMHNLTHRELSQLYPRFADAMEVRREFDPNNRFVTPYMASLFGIET